MGRLYNPAPTFTLKNGDIASNGKLYFYENGSTTTKKDTYSDPDRTIKNINPLPLTDAGLLPNCFGSGLYTVVLKDSNDVQQWVRNDVSVDELTGQFSNWSSVKNYNMNEIVRYTDGNYYYSEINNNIGNPPSVNSQFWTQIAFMEFFNTSKAADNGYELNDIVIYEGFIYRSLENNNGDTPPSAKWANLTFNDSVSGDFSVGGNLTVTGGITTSSEIKAEGGKIQIGPDAGPKYFIDSDGEVSADDIDYFPIINSNYFSAASLNTITATPVGSLTSAVLQYWVIGKLAFGLITCECSGAVVGIDIGNLPVGHRPAVNTVFPIAASDNERTLTIETGGDLIVNNVSYTLKRSTSIIWVIA